MTIITNGEPCEDRIIGISDWQSDKIMPLPQPVRMIRDGNEFRQKKEF
jgi:hypothetical protein